MRRLVVPMWLCGLALAIAWLRDLPTGGDASFAAARGFALAAAAYLLMATVANIALALCRVRVRLPLVPMLVVASLSASLAGGPAYATTSTSTPTSMPTPTPTSATIAPPVMHRLADAPAPAPTPPAPAPTAMPLSKPAPIVTPPSSPSTTWTVRHGQNFWSISASLTRTRLGRAPTNAEVAAYWHRLIDTNRSRLAHPSNPGLLFAGQELLLPSN